MRSSEEGIGGRHQATAGRLSTAAFIGIGVFVGLVVALHILEPDFDPASRYMSEYATADTGALMKLAFFSLAFAIGSVATALKQLLVPAKRVKASVVCLYVTAVGIFLSGVFDSDVLVDGEVESVSVSGALHDLSGIVAFVTLIAAAFMLRGVFSRDSLWAARSTAQLVFAVAILVLFVVSAASPADFLGLTQRIFIPIVLVWLATLAWWIRKSSGRDHASIDGATAQAAPATD
ncbi:MAG: DUF998 domain-containing protein [Microthrixaceae bacterium]